jgi:membrane protease YdiL (CAAX protease family)
MPNGSLEKGWASPECPKWTFLEVGIGVGVLLAFQAFASLPWKWIAAVPIWLWVIAAVISHLLMLAYPLALAKRRGFAAAYAWPARKKVLVEAGLSLPIIVGMLVLFNVVIYLIRRASPDTSLTPEMWQRVASAQITWRMVLLLLVAFTLGPVAEEIFFRGFLQNALRSRLTVLKATLLQSAIFAVLHIRYGPMYVVIVFFIGLILTAVYEWRKSLLTPVFVHAGWNMLFAVGIFASMVANAHSPVLGVVMQERSDRCLVTQVIPESAAEKAGLAQGDVITNLGRYTIRGSEDLRRAVRLYRAGDTVTIVITRNGARVELRAVLQKRSQVRPVP